MAPRLGTKAYLRWLQQQKCTCPEPDEQHVDEAIRMLSQGLGARIFDELAERRARRRRQ